jgi:hypothetical protein
MKDNQHQYGNNNHQIAFIPNTLNLYSKNPAIPNTTAIIKGIYEAIN